MSANKDFVIQSGTLVSYNGNDRDVIIPDGVTSIGRKAFFLKTFIESVELPVSVTVIESRAFSRCLNLKKLTILGRIEKIGLCAFDYLYERADLELYIYSNIPLSSFTKAGLEEAYITFLHRFSDFDPQTEVFRDNIRFIGKHLKLPQGKYSNKCCYHFLINKKDLRHAVLEANAIPAKDIDWLIEKIQAEGNTDFTAELLDYKNRMLSDEKIRKSLERSARRAEENALSDEISITEWRRRLRFTYENDYIVIKEIKIWEPITVIPAQIGKKKVRVIDSFAVNHWCKKAHPDTLILSEGIEEIRNEAFMFAKNMEIMVPNTVTAIPVYCFNAVSDLTLHIPISLTELPDIPKENIASIFKAIYAPAGSYAEQYAKEHNIPFVAE